MLTADEILRQAGFGTNGQELRNGHLLRSKSKRGNFKRKQKKKPWRSFEAIPWYEGYEHMQSIKQEVINSGA